MKLLDRKYTIRSANVTSCGKSVVLTAVADNGDKIVRTVAISQAGKLPRVGTSPVTSIRFAD